MKIPYRLFTVCLVCSSCFAWGEEIPLVIDATRSNVTVTISGSSENSSLSGTASIDLVPAFEPFDTAQVAAFDAIVDDAMSFSFLGGLVSASTSAGDVGIHLLTAGNPGAVDSSNQFDQLMNEIGNTGTVNVVDPFNLAGGTRTIDLSTSEPSIVDMLDIQLTVVGTELTVEATFSATSSLGSGVTMTSEGTIVGTGQLPVSADVVPDAVSIVRGVLSSGDVTSLGESDNLDLSVRRSATGIQAIAEYEIMGVSPIRNPGSMTFAIEGSVFSRGQVTQRVDLFNFQTGGWEQVDSRNASRFSDQLAEIIPTGDVSRFVDPATGNVEARILFQAAVNRQQFTSNVDLTMWTIGQ